MEVIDLHSQFTCSLVTRATVAKCFSVSYFRFSSRRTTNPKPTSSYTNKQERNASISGFFTDSCDKGLNNKNAAFLCNETILENKVSAFVYLRPFVSLFPLGTYFGSPKHCLRKDPLFLARLHNGWLFY